LPTARPVSRTAKWQPYNFLAAGLNRIHLCCLSRRDRATSPVLRMAAMVARFDRHDNVRESYFLCSHLSLSTPTLGSKRESRNVAVKNRCAWRGPFTASTTRPCPAEAVEDAPPLQSETLVTASRSSHSSARIASPANQQRRRRRRVSELLRMASSSYGGLTTFKVGRQVAGMNGSLTCAQSF